MFVKADILLCEQNDSTRRSHDNYIEAELRYVTPQKETSKWSQGRSGQKIEVMTTKVQTCKLNALFAKVGWSRPIFGMPLITQDSIYFRQAFRQYVSAINLNWRLSFLVFFVFFRLDNDSTETTFEQRDPLFTSSLTGGSALFHWSVDAR